MADVMLPSQSALQSRFAHRAERAQLLLITALALAVILVTVALLLNAAIFTENIATRDTTADGHEAIELRGELVDGIGEQLERENRHGQSESDIVDTVESGIEESAVIADLERARGGTIATLSYDSYESGKLLNSTEFEANGTEWTLVDEITNIRAVRFGLDPSGLYTDSDPTPTEIETNAFGVRFVNASTENETQYIYNDGSNVTVAQGNESSEPTQQCKVNHGDDTTRVDLTGDRLSSTESITDCHRGLWPEYNPDAVEFVNAGNATGMFSATVADGTNSPEIGTDPAVYSVTVDIGYQSQDLTFETTARVAPGEPR